MAADLTCDTSVVVAAFSGWHEHHRQARTALLRADWLAAHVVAESVSVLSRLPHGHAIPVADAVSAMRRVVDRTGRGPLQLRGDRYLLVLSALGTAGLGGGAVYDAIVGATAREHDSMLLSLDRRAQRTYDAVGATWQVPA